ncbi:MAG: alpha/beta hydrolase [Acholeplasmatales bacterium]|jgi:pimeloyl-ACP methyl ester carboxylesterase|nr:alpha/beta hydrolase [Acholeplasmatales bacterium]
MEELKYFYDTNDYIVYEKIGNGNINLVFLHGLCSSRKTWDDIYPKFDLNKYCLYLVDYKGYGNSSVPKDKEYSIFDIANVITKFINEVIKINYVLIGHSLGGGIVLMTMVSKKVNMLPIRIIVIDPACYMDSKKDIPLYVRGLGVPIINKIGLFLASKKRILKMSMSNFMYRDNVRDKHVARYTTILSQKRNHYAFIASSKYCIPTNYSTLIREYKGITTKTLIIWGENDPVLDYKYSFRLSKDIKNSKLVILSKCGHACQEELPDKTYKVIEDYLDKILKIEIYKPRVKI